MQALVSPSRLLICSIRALIADWVCGISQGGIRTTSPGLRMVTVLLPLETSIPTEFMIKLLCNELAIVNTRCTHCLFNLLGISHERESSTCVKRMLRMRAGWLTVLRTLSPEKERPDLLPNSF